MDHSSGPASPSNSSANINQNSTFDPYITQDGKQYRVPYHMIKKVIFSDIDKKQLIDIPHAARLQYRLMLKDPIIKATVDYTKSKITVIYNPDDADNYKEKISLDQLRDFLGKEGIITHPASTVIEDYDYVKSLYNYAYTPPVIRERAPYGYTMEQWLKVKPEWEQKMKESESHKKEKFKKFQEGYLESNPEIADKLVPGYQAKAPEKVGFFGKMMGKDKKKKKDNGKGFWFHGI